MYLKSFHFWCFHFVITDFLFIIDCFTNCLPMNRDGFKRVEDEAFEIIDMR